MVVVLNSIHRQQGGARTRRFDLPPGSGCRGLQESMRIDTVLREGCGPSHSLAARSSDRNRMRGVLQPRAMCCTERGGLKVAGQPREEENIMVTHLSNTPSVSPTLPGPNSTPQCSIDMRPESQGMREFSSTSRDAQLHSFMLTMGCFDASGRLRAG